jgi:hypothetical protein
MGISTGKLKIFTINDLKYCAKTEGNPMRIETGMPKSTFSSANRPSDIAVALNINAESNLSII